MSERRGKNGTGRDKCDRCTMNRQRFEKGRINGNRRHNHGKRERTGMGTSGWEDGRVPKTGRFEDGVRVSTRGTYARSNDEVGWEGNFLHHDP